jgi:PAS domain S-box-containing protein
MFEAQIRPSYTPFANQYDFIYLGHQTMSDMLDRVSKLPKHTVVLYFYLSKDGKGEAFKPWKVAGMVSEAANAPVYGISDTYFGSGIVGGALLSLKAIGRKTGEMGLRILKGENPADIPISAEGTTLNMFDWRQLKRWGINESDLPEGSIIRYKEWSFWELYKWYIIGGIFFMFLEGCIIFGLVFQRRRARQIEEKLRRRSRKLQKSEQQLSLIFDSIAEILYYIKVEPDDCFSFLSVNHAFLKATGLTRDQIVGKRVEEVIPETSVQMVLDNYKKAIEENRIVSWEETSVYPTGEKIGNVSIAPVLDEKGICTLLVGSVHDITERKEAEVRLLAAEAKYRSVAENAIEAIVVAQDEKMVFWNDRAVELTGYSAEEFATTSFVDFIHPDDRSKLMREYEERLSGEKATSRYTIRFLTKDGRHRWVSIGSSQINWEGRPASLAMISDITEQKDAEEKLREAEQKYRTVADFTYDWEYWEGPDGRLLYVSPSCERITGYRPSDFVDRPELIESIILPEDLASWNVHSHGEKMGKESGLCQFRIRVKEGTTRWIEHACRPVFDEQGNYDGVRASNREITELKRAEQEAREIRETLARLDRTATLGQLAGSIAHELNQPLTGILSNAQAGEMLLKQGDGNRIEI